MSAKDPDFCSLNVLYTHRLVSINKSKKEFNFCFLDFEIPRNMPWPQEQLNQHCLLTNQKFGRKDRKTCSLQKTASIPEWPWTGRCPSRKVFFLLTFVTDSEKRRRTMTKNSRLSIVSMRFLCRQYNHRNYWDRIPFFILQIEKDQRIIRVWCYKRVTGDEIPQLNKFTSKIFIVHNAQQIAE